MDVRFAWQAWDSGCIDALGKALAGGSAWQVWGNVHLDVGARAFRVAGVGLRMHRRARDGSGRWIRVAGVGKRAFGRCCACVSRGRCGARWPPEVSRTWIRVAGVGKRARSVRFAWQAWGMVRSMASLGIVLRGRRRESCTLLKSLDFVALCEKSRVRARIHALRVAKSWQAQGIRGFADVARSGRFVERSGGVSRVRRCAMERSGRQ